MEDVKFSDLEGLTLISVTGLEVGSESVTLCTADGRDFSMFHAQDCCESVSIEDIAGDPADILDSPILKAEESSSDTLPEGVPAPEYADSDQEWTFYRITTIRGTVVIRWFGSSNGYYSTRVYFQGYKNL